LITTNDKEEIGIPTVLETRAVSGDLITTNIIPTIAVSLEIH